MAESASTSLCKHARVLVQARSLLCSFSPGWHKFYHQVFSTTSEACSKMMSKYSFALRGVFYHVFFNLRFRVYFVYLVCTRSRCGTHYMLRSFEVYFSLQGPRFCGMWWICDIHKSTHLRCILDNCGIILRVLFKAGKWKQFLFFFSSSIIQALKG